MGTVRKRIVSILAIGSVIWELLYASGYIIIEPTFHRAGLLAVAILLVWFTKPLKTKFWLFNVLCDTLLIVATLLGLGYYIMFYNEMILRTGIVLTPDIIFGLVTVVAILEAVRRTVGWIFAVLVIIFYAQARFGNLIPFLDARAYSIERITAMVYQGGFGIFGLPLDVATTFIFIFVIFGAFFSSSGVGTVFLDLSFSLFGGVRGGPAKVSIFASGLMGTISGSAAANVMTTGVFTIPLMKRVGYSPLFAGAVESVASTGGMIMPPVMGSAAFLIAQFLGVSYTQVMIWSIIPALLYYWGLFCAIDAEAAKKNLRGLDRKELPKVSEVLKKGWYMFIPLVVLLYFLVVLKYTPSLSGLAGIVSVVLVSSIKKETRLNFKRLLSTLEDAGVNIVTITIACAAAGILVGTFSLTGLGMTLTNGMASLAGGNVYLLMLYIAIAGLIMGMGLPPTTIYLTLVIMLAPALSKLGIPTPVAHLFVFYYGVLSVITPPVGIASYAAASITKESFLKTGLLASRLALPLFIIPFTFALSPALLMIGEPVQVFQAIVTSIVAVYALSSSMGRYSFGKLKLFSSILMFLAGIFLLIPEPITDISGAILLILVIGYQLYLKRKENRINVQESLEIN